MVTLISSRAPRAALRVLAGLAVLGGVVLGTPGPASAHVALLGSTPGDGARLTAFPARVVLEFNQDVAPPAYAIVTGPGGSDLRAGDLVVDGPRVVVPTRSSRLAGAYTIAYRVVSVDGHPISGQLTATVGTVGAGTAQARPSTGEAAPDPVAVTASESAAATPVADPRSSRTVVASSVGITLFVLSGLLAVLARRAGPAGPHPHPIALNPSTRRNS